MMGFGVSLAVEPFGLLVHFGLFLMVVAIFSRWLLRPMARVFAARLEATTTRQQRASALNVTAEELTQRYHKELQGARQTAREIREHLRREGFAEAARVMAAARARALQTIEVAKQELHTEAEQAKNLLQAESSAFGQMIAERLLEREIAKREEAVQKSTRAQPQARKAN
ncbi:MAG: hypothetical protein HYV02_08455 [Deltaproteobacteria bacterium]|nr:hypothetical protein [Deltaproteobacteria bacterium]